MKQIILSPLFIALIMTIGAIYLLLLFTYMGRDKKAALTFEKICAGLFIFITLGATGVTLSPFTKLNPLILTGDSTTPPTIIGLLGFYGTCILILYSRLRYTLKDLVHVVALLIVRESALFTLFLIIGLSVFWSDTPTITLKTSLTCLGVSAVAIYLGKQYSWKELYALLRFALLFAVLFSFIKTNPGVDGNWSGILGHKNQFSFFMALSTALWFLYAFYNPKNRLISIIITILSLIALQKGGSGASRVLNVVLLSLWGYLGFVKKLKPQWAFVSVVLFLIVSICLSVVITDNFKFIVVDTLNKDMTLTGRTDFWPQVIDRINSRPLLGYGVAGFWQPWLGPNNPANGIISARTQFVPPHSHNGFLDMGLELGYVGVTLYIVIFFSNLAKGVVYLGRTKMPEAGLPILLLTFIIMTNFTETGIFGITSYWFWFVVITVRSSLDTIGNGQKREA